MQIENQKVVSLIYDLLIADGEGGEMVFEQATLERPLIYCHGEGMMLPAFEQALAGKTTDDSFDFRIPYTDAYGEYDEQGVMTLDKKMFYNGDNQFDSERVFVGAIVPMNTSDGQVINAQIAEITDTEVTIDLNHPLAGEDLHFVGKIIDLRDATPAELDAIRHPHCGGGCKGKCGSKGGNCKDCKDGCGNCSC